jgi:glycosyltransferase involved in cell wall biosynthesis
MQQGISAVIITLNEEANIANAVLSVKSWTNEVIVVDMCSDDRTQEIARSLGAVVIEYPRVAAFDGARVLGVEKATYDWILLLDADELYSHKLSLQLLELKNQGNYDAIAIPRLNYFNGAPMLHSGFGPAGETYVRLYRIGSVHLNATLHAHMEHAPGIRIKYLDFDPEATFVHFNYKSSSQFVAKLNKYTSLTASQRKDSKEFVDQSIVIVPVVEFLKRYLKKGGYKDGWRGFYYSFMMAAYRMTQNVKIKELQTGCDEEGATRTYQNIAANILREYGYTSQTGDR